MSKQFILTIDADSYGGATGRGHYAITLKQASTGVELYFETGYYNEKGMVTANFTNWSKQILGRKLKPADYELVVS